MAQIGPHSRLLARGSIDGRTRSGRFLRAYESQLVAHVGGRPSSTQLFLIRQLAVLALRCALMDAKAGEEGTFSERDARAYLSWSNALSRGLRQLGYAAAPPATPSLQDHLAARYGAPAPGEAA